MAFVADLDDYCLCEFVQEEGGWVKTVRVLRNDERAPGEEIPNTHIIALARAGNLLSAIRLYRAKHEVGLAEGKAGVEALLKHA